MNLQALDIEIAGVDLSRIAIAALILFLIYRFYLGATNEDSGMAALELAGIMAAVDYFSDKIELPGFLNELKSEVGNDMIAALIYAAFRQLSSGVSIDIEDTLTISLYALISTFTSDYVDSFLRTAETPESAPEDKKKKKKKKKSKKEKRDQAPIEQSPNSQGMEQVIDAMDGENTYNMSL